ncbi:MAG: hypothetical protein CMO30_16520 [Tistrella sp.]|uniref:Uncharacterized protein n=1 Tax=Tistrella mobilis TaxID=171437 RepID=A0A3B9IEY0_9PROT|nr:hypothetical protein [Tistrella sp.]HAE46330.1 hypothetical protein [Tistrella mobilis]|tara:strand:- start:376 stop:1179 length:804 start_codon:yes stop_codon:yes gene_type:complete
MTIYSGQGRGVGLILDHRNWAPSAALSTAAPVAAEMPLAHLLSEPVARPARVLATAFTIDIDLGAEQPVGALAIAGATLAATDTWVWSCRMEPGGPIIWQTDPPEAGIHPAIGFGLSIPVLPSPVLAARYWSLSVSAPSRSALGYVDLGYLWIGAGSRPAWGASYGWRLTVEDLSRITTAERSGVEWVDLGRRRRRLEFDLILDDQERGGVLDRDFDAGQSAPVLCVPNPAGDWAREGLIGRISSADPLVRSYSTFSDRSYTVREML